MGDPRQLEELNQHMRAQSQMLKEIQGNTTCIQWIMILGLVVSLLGGGLVMLSLLVGFGS